MRPSYVYIGNGILNTSKMTSSYWEGHQVMGNIHNFKLRVVMMTTGLSLEVVGCPYDKLGSWQS